jgi:hypothetical protein
MSAQALGTCEEPALRDRAGLPLGRADYFAGM